MNPSKLPIQALRWLSLAQLLSLAALAQTTAPDTDPAKKDVIELSPFTVVADNRGYYAANTMSGTRFNTKLDDLASSVTVMTKGQMSDFAMLDMNDIFLYVAGTEGTGTYTDFSLDRNGSIGDNVQNNPTQANRVRGIAPANISLGNIETMGRVPIDPISVESIEISRGPNANVFGLGNPSGTVNQVPVSANLDDQPRHHRTPRRQLRWLAHEPRREPGVAPGQAGDPRQRRVPTRRLRAQTLGVDTERYNVMLKYQPFKYTTISAAYSVYHAYGNRPNAIPPRDNLSYWIASAGRPGTRSRSRSTTLTAPTAAPRSPPPPTTARTFSPPAISARPQPGIHRPERPELLGGPARHDQHGESLPRHPAGGPLPANDRRRRRDLLRHGAPAPSPSTCSTPRRRSATRASTTTSRSTSPPRTVSGT